MAVQVCLNETNYLSFKGYLSNKLQNEKIAVPTWINGKKGFMKKYWRGGYYGTIYSLY